MIIDATYSAEDNKLRLYCSERLDSDLYSRVKEAGFKWAPKQDLFVAPRWTPAREDLCLELAGDISAEQSTLQSVPRQRPNDWTTWHTNEQSKPTAIGRQPNEYHSVSQPVSRF